MTTTVYLCIALLAIINFPFVLWVDRRAKQPGIKRVYDLDTPPEQLTKEMRNAWITTPVHALLLAFFVGSGLMKIGDDNAWSVVGSFIATLVWTEIWHYFSHRAMHWKSLHFIHREHHKSRITNAWTSVSFSFLEKFIFSLGILGFMAGLSHVMKVSVVGITIYYVLYFFTNTLGHANYEFRKPNYRDSWMGKVFNTPSYHAMHHARYVKNYGLLTPVLDRLFKTEWPDEAQVQTRAATNRPLRSLNERAEVP